MKTSSAIKRTYILLLVIGLLSTSVSYAGRGGMGVGNYDHPADVNNRPDYNHVDVNNVNGLNNRVWIDPNAAYINPTVCSTQQQCDDNGNCVQSEVCN